MRLARTAPPPPREVWLAGVEPAISGAQNRRGGLLPYSQWKSLVCRSDRPRSAIAEPRLRVRDLRTSWGAALAAPGSRRPWNRTTLHRRIRAALAQPARRRKHIEASPGNRTLLAGITTRGLASSRATQSRREESNPRASTVGAWCSPLSYGEMNALDGSRTRLARQTTGSRLQTRPRACCEVPRAGIEPALPV
jgi:hypothetical protein